MANKSETAIEMFVGGLMLDPNTQAPVVVLKDETGNICLPIWIGVTEATSIASAIKQVPMARPLTHDLMYDIFNEISVKVKSIVITELRDSTYYAELLLSFGDRALIVDSRPSDAIAIALRAAAPIFVTQKVLDQAKITFGEKKQVDTKDKSSADETDQVTNEGQTTSHDPMDSFNSISKDKWNELLDDLDPDDFKYKM